MLGTIMGVHVAILVDLGSSHNFIDTTLLTILQLKVDPFSSLSLKIVNGKCLQSKELCNIVNFKVQSNMFQTSFYLLDLVGCEVVLGIQWLQTLWTITLDFSELLMTFVYTKKYVNFRKMKLNQSTV